MQLVRVCGNLGILFCGAGSPGRLSHVLEENQGEPQQDRSEMLKTCRKKRQVKTVNVRPECKGADGSEGSRLKHVQLPLPRGDSE